MSYFMAKMHQVQLRLGLCPRPRWDSSQCYHKPPSWIQGDLLLRRKRGKRKWKDKRKRKGRQSREKGKGMKTKREDKRGGKWKGWKEKGRVSELRKGCLLVPRGDGLHWVLDQQSSCLDKKIHAADAFRMPGIWYASKRVPNTDYATRKKRHTISGFGR